MTPDAARLDALPRAEDRGTGGMLLFIATEALLFVSLFFAYFYLGADAPIWPPHPPKIALALVMLAVLLASSAVLHVGERASKAGRHGRARAAVLATIFLALVFVGVQALEYRNHLEELRPTDSAYGSIFYGVTSFHALHLVGGLLMLAFVAALPSVAPSRPPHRALHNAALYWHFVDLVWVFIVGLLYLLPRVHGAPA